MASKVDTWDRCSHGTEGFCSVMHSAEKLELSTGKIPEWAIRLIDDVALDRIILGRPRSRTSRSGLFQAGPSREFPDFVDEVDTVPSYLPEHGSVLIVF